MMIHILGSADFELRLLILQGQDFRVPVISFYIIQVCLCEPSYNTSASTFLCFCISFIFSRTVSAGAMKLGSCIHLEE